MFRLFAILCSLLVSAAAFAGDGAIEVRDAYARGPGPAPVGAVFLTLFNGGATADRLLGASSDAAPRVELHTHAEDADGVMRMGPVEGGLPLAPGETRELMRGGDHVMLMGLAAPLETGQEIELVLSFEQAGDIVVTVPVDNDRAVPGHD